MVPSQYRWQSIDDFRGGRNATDDPLSLSPTQVVQMRNGDTFRVQLFRKRGGATAPNIGSLFTGVLSSLIGHFPNNNPANAELWGVDDANPPVIGRMAAASTFSAPTMTDAITAAFGNQVRGVSYNGKLVLAFKSATDRPHVYDPNLSAARVRRIGLATPSAPTVANSSGGGTYAAVARYYRQRYRIKHGSIVDAQSEPSASTAAFTPDGSHTAATITKSASISESETHVVFEGSADNVTFYEIVEQVVGTTTYDDTTLPVNYSTLPLSPLLGAYATASSWKYVIAAFNRILGMGGYASGALQSRIYFTPAKGTSDKGDDERVPNTLTVRNWLDIGEGIGGDGTGFAGPLYGSIYAFKYTQIRQLTPTGAPSPVFDVIELSTTRGALEQECIALGEDAQGRPCVYFLDSQVGPMIVGAMPPTEIGNGVRDQWDSVNLSATSKAGWVLDYPTKGQVWFAWATGANNDPNLLAIYTKATGAWQIWDTGGKIRLSRAAVLFARTLGTSMSRDKVPYVGYLSANNTLLRCDTTDLDDSGTTFQALVKSRPYAYNNGKPFRFTTPFVLATAQAGVTLTVTADIDFGRDTRSGTIDLTPVGSETRVFRKVQGLDGTDATFVQFQVGDAAEIAAGWSLERIYVPVLKEDIDP